MSAAGNDAARRLRTALLRMMALDVAMEQDPQELSGRYCEAFDREIDKALAAFSELVLGDWSDLIGEDALAEVAAQMRRTQAGGAA